MQDERGDVEQRRWKRTSGLFNRFEKVWQEDETNDSPC